MLRVVKAVAMLALLGGFAALDPAQNLSQNSQAIAHPAEALYLKLRSVGLDKAQVYTIREATLERAKLHISLDDGTIAFTEAVDGHITGAFFQGYGEVLLMPPNQMERASMSLFTGSAILEETFSSAYFRFNDDVLSELRPYLRPAEDPAAFVSQYDATARTLAGTDGLRLLLDFCEFSKGAPPTSAPGNRMLHAYLEGNKLGPFDVRYDSLLKESIEAGQHKRTNDEDYYNVWASFAVPLPGTNENGSSLSDEEDEAPNADLDISSFKIQAQIRPVKELDATAILSVTARQKTNRALLFELSRMLRVTEVRADGKPVEFIHNQAIEGAHLAKQGNDVIAVILPAPLEKGQKVTLQFAYSGDVLSEAANGLLFVGEHGTWYPNVGFSMASFDLQFTYPMGWTLVATGHRAETKTSGGEQISKWTTERPVPVAGFNLGKYSQNVNHVGKVAITTYATSNVERGFPGTVSLADSAPPISPMPRPLDPRFRTFSITPPPPTPVPSGNVQMVGEASVRAIDFYQRYFGPYPYGELAITQMPGPVSQGWPGLIFLSSYAYLTSEEKSRLQPDPVQRTLSDEVIAHETAHQWWGDLVNWGSYHDQWIMEGLANYSALMLLESRDPIRFRQVMQLYRDDLIRNREQGHKLSEAGPVTLGFRLSSSELPGAYEAVCYGRGTWLFHMLRTMMRDAQPHNSSPSRHLEDEPFIRALRKLRNDYSDKAITTAELMHVFEAELPQPLWYEGHKSLAWFTQGWVNGTAVPSFELHDVKFTDKGKITLVSGTIVQEQSPETLVTAVPLYASIGGKSVLVKRVFAEGQETQFHLSVPPGTRKLVIDPDHTLLSRLK
jgi:hypothetical protein